MSATGPLPLLSNQFFEPRAGAEFKSGIIHWNHGDDPILSVLMNRRTPQRRRTPLMPVRPVLRFPGHVRVLGDAAEQLYEAPQGIADPLQSSKN
jgi:hypothetical protein